MSDNPRAAVLARIEEAQITATLYRTARRLLDRVSDNGHVRLSHGAMASLAACNTARARKHLVALQAEGLIHYSRNDLVYVNFTGWPAPAVVEKGTQEDEKGTNDAAVVEKGTNQDEKGTPGDLSVVEKGTQEDEKGTNDAAVVEKGTNQDEKGTQEDEKGTNDDTRLLVSSYNNNSSVVVDTQTALGLLTDAEIGMSATDSEPFVNRPLDWVRRHVWAYLRDVDKGKVNHVGALRHRMTLNWGTKALTSDEKGSDLYRRHMPEAEIAAVSPPPPQAPDPQQEPETGLWGQILPELLLLESMRHHLEGSRQVSQEDGRLIVHVDSPLQLAWLNTRYSRTVERRLLSMTGLSIDAIFIHEET